jgi:cardiolipin synthase
VFILLGRGGLTPEWLVILVVFRDVLIVGGVILFHTAQVKVTMAPLLISKFNSLVQLVYAGWLLAATGFALEHPAIGRGLLVLVVATTAASGIAYVVQGGRRIAGEH